MVAEKNSAGRRVIYNGSVLKDQNEQKTDRARAKRI